MNFGTLTARTRSSGLVEGLQQLVELEPRGLILQADGPDPELPRALALVRSWKVPVLAGIAPLVRRGPRGDSGGGLSDESEAARQIARDLVARSAQNLGQLGCANCVVPVRQALPEAVDADLRRRVQGGEAAALEDWRKGYQAAREEAALQLCRELYTLGRAHPRSRFLMCPSADPFDLLDRESIDWVLGELPSSILGIALHTGLLGLRVARGDGRIEDWIGQLRPRASLLLLADHDGQKRADLLFGTGQSDRDALRGALEVGVPGGAGTSLPFAVLPDPELSGIPFLRESADAALHCFGPQ